MSISNPITSTVSGSITLLESDPLMVKLCDDPWSLGFDERMDLRNSLAAAQAAWTPRLQNLVEPPAIDSTFPGFLLETPPFQHIARAVGDAQSRQDLDTGTADELQRFADRYRDYLQPRG